MDAVIIVPAAVKRRYDSKATGNRADELMEVCGFVYGAARRVKVQMNV